MKNTISRGRLLAGAAFGLGLALVPQQAQAQCVVSPAGTPVTGTVTCADTTTVDTTYPTTAPDDRNYEVDTSGGDVTGTVSAGATVDGFGLAFTNTVGGANDLIVVNDGTVQVDSGNTATAGGSAALDISATGATNVDYSGTGSIINLSTSGRGLTLESNGTGNLTADVGGDVSNANTGVFAIALDHSGTAGDLSVTTATGTTVTSGWGGVLGQITNAASAGSVTITNNATISSNTGVPNTLDRGIWGSTSGTGAVSITNDGAIGSDTDRVQLEGIVGRISNAASTADLTVEGTGAISSAGLGLDIDNAGSGTTTINYTGAIDTTGVTGVDIDSTGGGAVDVTLGDVTATGGIAVDIDQTDAAGAGDVTLNTTGDLAASTTAVDIDNAGTGAVDVDVEGGIVADTGDAIRVSSSNAAAGDIDVTTGDGDITGGAAGIDVTSTGTGDITITTGDGLVTGSGRAIDAFILNAASAGDVVITVGAGGATSTGANAVAGTTLGTGDVIVTSSGPVSSDVASGIVTAATTGATTVDVTGGSVTGDVDGINATATTGTIGVTLSGGADVTGTVSGIDVASTGARTITVGAGSVVTGGTQAIFSDGDGAFTLNNSGTVGTAGGLAVWFTGGTTDANINNLAGGVLNGRLDLNAGNDTVTNAGTWNASGANNFYAGTNVITNQATGILNVAVATSFTGLTTLTNAGTVNAASGFTLDGGDTAVTNTGTFNAGGTFDFGAGTDSFANNASGILNVNSNTTLLGLETFTNSGRINLNTFVLTGPPIAFTNSGFIDTNGNAGLGGFTSFNNAGTLDLAAGTFTVPAAVFTNSGLILADEGATTITGQTSFANSGTLDLQDGVPNDVLTINSNFAGSGGSNLMIDFNSTTSDRLVINGAASGSTAVHADYLGGFNLDGVLVVDTVSSSANAFVLGSVTGDSPLLDVSLVQAGADYFLVAAPTAAAFNPLVVPGFATDLWYQSADEIFAETVKPATTSGISFWGEGYISRDKYGDDDDTLVVDGIAFDVDNELKTKRHGLQMGVDYGFDGGGRVGLTGGYAWAKASGNADADLKAKGWNLGLYGQFGGLTGFHGEFLAKHDRYKARFTDGAFDGEKFDIRSTGVDGSLGYRFGMGGAATMDVHAGLSHVRTKVDDINAFGFNYDIAKLTSTRGRAGVRAILGGGMAPYVDATVYREFKGGGDIDLFDGFDNYDLDTRGKGTWVRLEAGLSGNNGPGPILAAWGDLGDRKGIGLRAGWRLGGRVAEALPPPPPPAVSAPPPPPPPATQTCPDGSVILATDMCPPPPPPPPPPPEPERG